MKILILVVGLLFAYPAVAQAPNCWWDGGGMRCRGGWMWNHDRREERREEQWERRNREEQWERREGWRRHEEWCRYHRC